MTLLKEAKGDRSRRAAVRKLGSGAGGWRASGPQQGRDTVRCTSAGTTAQEQKKQKESCGHRRHGAVDCAVS
jgi:hypothetical protein